SGQGGCPRGECEQQAKDYGVGSSHGRIPLKIRRRLQKESGPMLRSGRKVPLFQPEGIHEACRSDHVMPLGLDEPVLVDVETQYPGYIVLYILTALTIVDVGE